MTDHHFLPNSRVNPLTGEGHSLLPSTPILFWCIGRRSVKILLMQGSIRSSEDLQYGLARKNCGIRFSDPEWEEVK